VLATTHDLPPLEGYLAGRDLEIRRALGGISSDASLSAAKAARAAERGALVETLVLEGDLPPGASSVDDASLGSAVNAYLGRSPARLAALALDDLAGETEPLNLPGVPVQRHRSWSRRMRRDLDEIAADPRVRAEVARAARGVKR
jgi:4-alpha-glucanotransferase